MISDSTKETKPNIESTIAESVLVILHAVVSYLTTTKSFTGGHRMPFSCQRTVVACKECGIVAPMGREKKPDRL